jgi:hypothetical protein
MHDIYIMTKDIGIPIRQLSKNTLFYPIISHTKIRKTFICMNENQKQYSHTMILHYTILHLTALAVQHPF